MEFTTEELEILSDMLSTVDCLDDDQLTVIAMIHEELNRRRELEDFQSDCGDACKL